MNQKIITTDKATLFVVEIDDLQEMLGVEKGCIWYLRQHNNNLVDKTIKLPEGNWQLLGRMPDITEEQVKKIVDKHFMDGCRSYDIYRDYRLNPGGGRWIDNSFESLYSLLQANDCGGDMGNTYLFIKVDKPCSD